MEVHVMSPRRPFRPCPCALAVLGLFVSLPRLAADEGPQAPAVLKAIGTSRGLCAVLGDPGGSLALALARQSELKVHVQCTSAEEVQAVHKAADAAGLLGTRLFA